jgi:hypothetical protein
MVVDLVVGLAIGIALCQFEQGKEDELAIVVVEGVVVERHVRQEAVAGNAEHSEMVVDLPY